MKKETGLSAKHIDLIVYDFDGVMTDNRVIVLQDGTEGVFCNRADGLGIDIIRSAGIPQLIISTERNPVVEVRAKKLCIDVIYNCGDKKKSLELFCEQNGYKLSRVVYLGNDINDLELMKAVGMPLCPADAHYSIVDISLYKLSTEGGFGVIRELADMLMERSDNLTYG